MRTRNRALLFLTIFGLIFNAKSFKEDEEISLLSTTTPKGQTVSDVDSLTTPIPLNRSVTDALVIKYDENVTQEPSVTEIIEIVGLDEKENIDDSYHYSTVDPVSTETEIPTPTTELYVNHDIASTVLYATTALEDDYHIPTELNFVPLEARNDTSYPSSSLVDYLVDTVKQYVYNESDVDEESMEYELINDEEDFRVEMGEGILYDSYSTTPAPSPQYRFIFPPNEITADPVLTEEQVLVNEAGVPRNCVSYVKTLRKSFVKKVNDLLRNVSSSCPTVKVVEPTQKECSCSSSISTTITPTTTTVSTTTSTSTTTDTTTTMPLTSFADPKPDKPLVIISENYSSVESSLKCNEAFNMHMIGDYETHLVSTTASPLLILSQFGRAPTLTSHEDYKLFNSNTTTIKEVPSGTFLRVICLCEEGGPACEVNITAKTIEIQKLSFLSDEPLIIEAAVDGLLSSVPELVCDDRCYAHGTCSNGTCLCNYGWNGRHCSLPGCQNNCGHGECVEEMSVWRCACESGWEGEFCEHPLELNCSDKIDNDGDGLTDCQDPECCFSDPVCGISQLCLTVDDPESILRNNISLHFFQGILPLLDKDSGIQRYAKMSTFAPSRVSVIRGRVITKKTGSGLLGVRISKENGIGEGFTLSRKQGYFDFVTNGGSVVVLKFGKIPFPFLSRRIYVPSNQIIDVGAIIMDSEHDWSLSMATNGNKYCPDHSYGNLTIEVPSSNHLSKINIVVLDIEGSHDTKLVYSTDTNATRIQIRLIKHQPPSTLIKIRLEIRIGGRFYSKLLEPEKDLKVEYVWDRRDVYGRPIFGKIAAFIRAGYEYSNCVHSPIWISKTIRGIEASSLSHDSSGINNGWSLNLHHRLDPVSKILRKGDGTKLDLTSSRFHARLKEYIMANDGTKPTAILINPLDDSVVLGFSSLIKLYRPDINKLKTLLRLNATSEEGRYYLALNPTNGEVYVSLPMEKFVIKISKLREIEDESRNFEIIAGNGRKCRSLNNCGDGGSAAEASLIYPKGIAISSDGTIYLADGRSLRRIREGRIESLNEGGRGQDWRPPSAECDSAWQTRGLNLRWPTDVALNPLEENSLVYIDDGDVFEYVINSGVARPLFAAPAWCSDISRRSLEYLEEDALSVEFDSDGILYIVVNRMTDSIKGEKSGIMRLDESNRLVSAFPVGKHDDIPEYEFTFISDFAVGNDGSFLICDYDNDKVHRLSLGELSLNFENKYEVSNPPTNEVYSFSIEGVHLETKALFTDAPLISFLYDELNNVIGVTNLYKSTLEIERDYDDAERPVKGINIDGKLRHTFKVSDEYDIKLVRFPSGNILSFGYENGTLMWKLENGKLRTIYEYDSLRNYVRTLYPDGTMNSLRVENDLRVDFESRRVPGRASMTMRDVILPHEFKNGSINLEWDHYVRASSRSFDAFNGIGKHFLVNGKRSFSLEMHPRSGIQSLYDGGSASKRLLRVEDYYVPPRRLWIPEVDTGLAVVDETFTRDRMLSSIKRGNTYVNFNYDANGRIISINSSERVEEFIYNNDEDAFPATVLTTNGAEYLIQRDDSGGLSSVTTPSNNSFKFNLIPLVGYYLMTYHPPWKSTPFMKRYRRHEEKQPQLSEARVSSGWAEEIYRYDETTGRIIEDDLFFYDYGVTSAVIQKTDSTFYGIYESDSLGRETARLMINDGRTIYREACSYEKDYLSSRSYLTGDDDSSTGSLEENKKTTNYTFDSSGLLTLLQDKSFVWKYFRDGAGNVVVVDFGAGTTEYEIEYGERISRVGKDFNVSYNIETGFMVSRHEFHFDYDESSRIESTFKGDQISSTFFYDDEVDPRRILQIYNHGILIAYEYERRDKPLLPTRVVRENPERNSTTTTRLFYDHLDRLFFVFIVEDDLRYYVVTDLAGTPEMVFDSVTGRIVKTYVRSPYGVLIAEKGDPDLWIPIGFKGGIEEHSSGTVIIEGRAYDSHLGQYRTPEIETFLNPDFKLTKVRDIHSYKMDYPVTKSPQVDTLRLNNFESWLNFLGLLTPKELVKNKGKLPSSFESVQVQQNFEFRDGNARQVTFHRGISYDSQLLGPDVVLSINDDNLITTELIRGAGTVEQILSSLINGTTLIETDKELSGLYTKITLHFYRREFELPESLGLLKAASIVPEYNYIVPSRKLSLKIDVVKFVFVFWIGFDDLEEAVSLF